MDNQLNTLIALYEEEKLALQKLIKESIAEAEYLSAHCHANALSKLNGQLHTLYMLEDVLYDEKQYKLREIQHLKESFKEADSGHMKMYFANEILQAKEYLEKLNQTPSRTANENPTLLLDNVLKSLLNGKVKNVKLILSKADKLFLAFAYSSKTLKVTIPYVKRHLHKWTLHHSDIEGLENLGFRLTENGSKLILLLVGEKNKIFNNLIPILLKLLFEIFYIKQFENKSFIQYTNKANHASLPF